MQKMRLTPMEKKCPYCGGVLERTPVAFGLSPGRQKIFYAILTAGADGVNAAALTKSRSTIHYINEIIKPKGLAIVSKGGRYRIEKHDDDRC